MPSILFLLSFIVQILLSSGNEHEIESKSFKYSTQANIDPNKVIMLIISHEPTTSKFTSTLKHGNGKIITIKSFDKILQFLLNHQQQIDEVQFLEVIFTPTLIHSIQQLNPAVLSRLVKFIKCDFRELLVAQFWQFFTVIIKPASLVLVDASGVSNERIGTLMNISSPFDGSLSLIREEGDGDLLQLDPDLIYTFCREKGQQLVIEEPFIKGDGQFLIDMFLQRFLHDLKPKVEGSDPYHVLTIIGMKKVAGDSFMHNMNTNEVMLIEPVKINKLNNAIVYRYHRSQRPPQPLNIK